MYNLMIKRRDPTSTKRQGDHRPQIFQELTPQIRKFTFYCIFTLQFQKVRGSADPTDPMLARPLNFIIQHCTGVISEINL